MAEYWYEDQIENSEEEDIVVNEYDISSVPNDFNMSTLFNLIESGIVKIPDFQRNYVWEQNRASKLIESIILGLPIPQVFFYESEKNSYLIIDGQQRLLSIYFFFKQRFPKESARNLLREEFEKHNKVSDALLNDDNYFVNFTLKLNEYGVKNNYSGKKFSTLDESIKNQFEHMRTMRSVVIRQNAPDDSDSSMFEIFNRLNTGGQNLTAQEIRSSLYYSDFYNMLNEVNQNSAWRQLIKKAAPDVHSKDVEMILRSFTLLFDGEKYKPSMTRSLNRFSKKAKTFDSETIDYLKQLFESFVLACSNLDDAAFCPTGRFNVSIFDATFVATCREPFERHDLVTKKISKKSFDELRKSGEFLSHVQSNTASTKSVLGRIELAKEILVLE